MKTILFYYAGLLLPIICFSQGGWTKVTDGPVAAFNVPGVYKGAAWVDINNDGNTDLFAMPGSIFLNSGNGVFLPLAGLNINSNPLQVPGGCSWGDINNDGYIDFITAQNPSEIYLNNGDNTFQNITSTIPQLAGYASWGAALADINNDNKLDLLYAQAMGFHGAATPYPCKLFTQDASFGFTPVTGYDFTTDLKPYTVPYFDDYDMDGDMDIFIASGPGGTAGPDFCYRNLKKETGNDGFAAMTAEPWATQLQDGQCYNFIDYDNDGDLDMCLTNYGGAASRFYRNNGNENYQAVATPFTSTGTKLANDWGDYDNDGDLDVIIARDSAPLQYYKNNGNGTFTLQAQSISVASGSSNIINSDYDNDGDLDVFVNGLGEARSLWRNDAVAENRNWVSYALKGVVSNRSAIGAFVKIKATVNGISGWQLRHVTAQNSFQGQNDLRVHFGLNDATVIDSLIIHWPSGLKEYYRNKNGNAFETLVEGNGTPLAVKNQIKPPKIKLYPNPANHYVVVALGDFPPTTANLKVADMTGRLVYDAELKDRDTKIAVNEWQDGNYVFIVDIEGKLASSKLLLKH